MAAEQRLAALSWQLVQVRQQYHACRGPYNYWYWGHVWFGAPGRYAWVPYWPNHCWGQLLSHRYAIWAYTAARIRRDRALVDWRWAQRRYRMCLQFRRWPSYYGLNTSAALSPAARMSPSGGVALLAPSGSPDSK